MSTLPTPLPLMKTVDASYQRYRGKPLGVGFCPDSVAQATPDVRLEWVHTQAPFILLVQDARVDPHFIYANTTASWQFEYSAEELLSLPARLSATSAGQEDRNAVLKTTRERGFVVGYSGVRITKAGKLFRIRDGELWLVHEQDGRHVGLAALVWPAPL